MDLRRVAWIVIAFFVACAPASANEDANSNVAGYAAPEDEAELELDPATLAELDALLVDPVNLESGVLGRLRALPWLEGEAIAALEAVAPPRGLDDLARVPGWDADLARRVAPFVRFAPRPSRVRAAVGLAASDAALGGRFESPFGSVACRVSARAPRIRHGFGSARWKRWTVMFGDLRLGRLEAGWDLSSCWRLLVKAS